MWVDKSIAQPRYDICKTCNKFIALTAQCKECGCFMKVKVKLAGVVCPLKKW
jgi:hypothetical protein